jgi:hypothetical protein
VTGFVEAEGCFHINVYRSLKSKQGYAVKLEFIISQHNRDKQLLLSFTDYLGCGNYSNRPSRRMAGEFKVTKFKYVFEKIIPFFEKYPLIGIKKFDYRNFCEIAKIMEEKSHLTPEGLKKIKSLKSGMNTGRMYD